jgi:AcrR family transcriptional regulator
MEGTMPNLSPETRQRILEAAEELFSHRSFEKVRMEDIAEWAKIGKGTVYRYYPTKDDLYMSLLEWIGGDYLIRLREADGSVRGCRARLTALVRVAMEFFTIHPNLLKLVDRAGIERDREHEDFPWRDVQRQLFRMLQGLFAEGAARGEFQVDDLELAVRSLLGCMRFQYLYPCVEVSKEDFAERLVGMLIRPASTSAKVA